MKRNFSRFLTDSFFAGVIIILPLILTIGILRFIISKLNSILLSPIANYLALILPVESYRIGLAKIIIFLLVVLLVAIIGMAARIFVIRRVMSIFERILYRLPMINTIYSATKDISNAFLDKHKRIFKQVVLIEYPRKGIYSIAFVTSEIASEANEKTKKELISVYTPTVPNPTSGVFLLVPKDEIIPLNMSVEHGLKMVISAGIITAPNNKNGYTENPGNIT